MSFPPDFWVRVAVNTVAWLIAYGIGYKHGKTDHE